MRFLVVYSISFNPKGLIKNLALAKTKIYVSLLQLANGTLAEKVEMKKGRLGLPAMYIHELC